MDIKSPKLKLWTLLNSFRSSFNAESFSSRFDCPTTEVSLSVSSKQRFAVSAAASVPIDDIQSSILKTTANKCCLEGWKLVYMCFCKYPVMYKGGHILGIFRFILLFWVSNWTCLNALIIYNFFITIIIFSHTVCLNMPVFTPHVKLNNIIISSGAIKYSSCSPVTTVN